MMLVILCAVSWVEQGGLGTHVGFCFFGWITVNWVSRFASLLEHYRRSNDSDGMIGCVALCAHGAVCRRRVFFFRLRATWPSFDPPPPPVAGQSKAASSPLRSSSPCTWTDLCVIVYVYTVPHTRNAAQHDTGGVAGTLMNTRTHTHTHTRHTRAKSVLRNPRAMYICFTANRTTCVHSTFSIPQNLAPSQTQTHSAKKAAKHHSARSSGNNAKRRRQHKP